MPFKTIRRTAACFAVIFVAISAALYGQTNESAQDLKRRAFELSNQQKFTEALPLLEKVVVSDPNDPDIHFYLGFALLGQAQITKDGTERAALRVRARNSFVRAKELGVKYPVVDALIEGLPVDGADSAGGKTFSANPAANDLMNQGEAFFAEGKLESALNNYKAALQLDPKIYEAALYSGDVYNQKNDYGQAEIWYQKAITIDPSRETAYRYSATPWMKQKRYDVARERYIAAYLAEPYSKFSAAGLKQWAGITNTHLGNPSIDIPTSVSYDEKGGSTVNLDVGALAGGKNDGSFAWIIYGGTRSLWKKERFAKAFPTETKYRHSLPEEADALRSVVHMAATDKKVTALSPSLAALKKLDDAGLLEAYILLVKADQGIAVDYPGYLKQNRDKLYRYVIEYVLTGGGSNQ
jgi:tetratricopeptide (TPR) repeat protein